jgi:hypothetical protein
VAGFPKTFKIVAYGNGRKRSAAIVKNNNIDAVAIEQISEEGATFVEFNYRGKNVYGGSLYFAMDRDNGRDIGKVEEIREHSRGKGLFLSIDSNSRSRLWDDTHTNQRGKPLEEFRITSDLLLMNEATDIPTFETIRVRNSIDLTLLNNILAPNTRRWTNGGEESYYDHKLTLFDIELRSSGYTAVNYARKRYQMKQNKIEHCGIFEKGLVSNLLSRFNCENNPSDLTKCDEELGGKSKQYTDPEELMTKFISIVSATCDAAFKVSRAGNRVTKGRSVPWWTSEITILRKRTLTLRRKYQRTRNYDNLRQERKLLYYEGKRQYQAKLQEEKLRSWKEFCSQSTDSIPWNSVYEWLQGNC